MRTNGCFVYVNLNFGKLTIEAPGDNNEGQAIDPAP